MEELAVYVQEFESYLRTAYFAITTGIAVILSAFFAVRMK
jgi:hypothetical protein